MFLIVIFCYFLLFSFIFSAFYDDSAFLRDTDSRNILPNTAAGLHSILFALSIDTPSLNTIAPARALDDLLPATAPTSRHPPGPVIRQDLSPVIGGCDEIKGARKKARKAPVKIVSFDDEGGASSVAVTSATRRKLRHARTGSSASESKAPVDVPVLPHSESAHDLSKVQVSPHSESTHDLSKVHVSPVKGHRRGHSDTSMLSNFGSKLWRNFTTNSFAPPKRKELQSIIIADSSGIQDGRAAASVGPIVTSQESWRAEEVVLGSSFGSFCGSLRSEVNTVVDSKDGIQNYQIENAPTLPRDR